MFYLSKKIDFSAAHYYWVSEWSDQMNQKIFGRCSNRNGHGHDYSIQVMIKGPLIEKYGIVVNATEVKRIVNLFLEEEISGKLLNLEHPYFQIKMPTTENLALYFWNTLRDRFKGCELHQIRLSENHYLYSEKEEGSMIRLTRKYHFCAAHRLHCHQLSPEENLQLFGKCNNPHGHGHNYFLDVTVHGEPDPVTGMIINLNELDEIVQKIVLDKFDHKNLNLDTEEFRELNPTAEVMAMVIYNMLKPHLQSLYKVGLWETDKNYFEYIGPYVPC